MFKTTTFFILLLICHGAMSQDFFPRIQPFLSSGLEKLTEDYPYVLEQTLNDSGLWTNTKLNTSTKSSLADFFSFKQVENWRNKQWVVEMFEEDSIFEVNHFNQPLRIVEHSYLNYPYLKDESRFMYTFSYTPEGLLLSFNAAQETYLYSEKFKTMSQINIANVNGKRMVDTVIGILGNYITHYVYENNKVVSQHSLYSNNDTFERTFYKYQDTLATVFFQEAKVAGKWALNFADTIAYNNGLITQHIRYGHSSGFSAVGPISNDSYTYHADGTLSTITEKTMKQGVWTNTSFFRFYYNQNGQPTIGLRFMATNDSAYAPDPRYRYLFSPNSSGISTVMLSDDDVLIRPNPVNDFIKISCPIDIEALSVYNTFGQMQHQEVVPYFQKDLTINTSLWLPGVYFMHIATKRGHVVKRLIVSH